MAVQSYVITKRTGSYARPELKDGTPTKYILRNPEYKDKKTEDSQIVHAIYSYRHNNIIKLEDADYQKLKAKLGLVLYVAGKRAEVGEVKIPKNFKDLPLGNLVALAALFSGIPIEKLTKSKAIDILTPLVEAEEKEEA